MRRNFTCQVTWRSRSNAARCLALSERARPEARQAFIELAATWRKLAAEAESDEALFRAICEMDLVEHFALGRRAMAGRSGPMRWSPR